MSGEEGEGAVEKGLAGFHAVPGRGAGGMGQRDAIGFASAVGDAKGATDGVVQWCDRQELGDGEFADRENEFRLEKGELAFEPGGAVGDFDRCGDAVAAFGAFAGETAADGGEVDAVANLVLGPAESLVEPFEEGFAGGPGEGAAEDGLLVAGGLADQDDAGDGGASDDGRRNHAGTAAAGAKRDEVFFD